MLDDWLERLTREPPATRAKRQVRALQANTQQTLRQLDQHPHDQETPHILHAHQQREQAIRRWGLKPPPGRCRTCGIVLPGPPSDFWTNKLGIKLLWAALIALLVSLLAPVLDWWALVVFPAGWLVSLSFFWSITVPCVLLSLWLIVLVLSGL
jgi:hypothetical protein